MMNFEEFTNAVLKAVYKKTGGKFDISVSVKLKNNGIKCTGISAKAEGSSNGLCVYLDGYYKEYGNGNIKPVEAADEVYRQIVEYQDILPGMNAMDFLHWENIRDHVHAKLVNAERNEEMLRMVPHRLFLDLAIVYYIAAEEMDGDNDISTVVISSRHMSLLEQSEEALYETAVYNMHSSGGALFDKMANIFKGLGTETADLLGDGEFLPDIGIYVLTNRYKYYGASMILDQNILEEISNRMKGDFVVLPSSVHEVLILPSEEWMEYSGLASIVQEVNATGIRAEEFLSGHIYVYDRITGSMKIAA